MRRYYYVDDNDVSGRVIFIILIVIFAVAWGIIHFLDWITFDIIPWWCEPIIILSLVPILIIGVTFGTNPMHWWPMFWGHKVPIDKDNWFWLRDYEELQEKYGGDLNVYWGGQDYIKFRRRRDAFLYCITNLRRE